MGGVDLVAAVSGPGRNDADRGWTRHHGADLDGRGVRAEQPSVGKVEGVLLVARRMVGRCVQRVEAVPLGLDIGAVGDRKPEPAENLHGTIHQQGERVKRSRLLRGAGKRGINRGQRHGVGLQGESGLFLLERRRDSGSQVVEKLAHDGTLLLGEGAHPLAQQGDRTGLAEVADASLLHRRGIGRSRDRGERLEPELFDLGFHGMFPGEIPGYD